MLPSISNDFDAGGKFAAFVEGCHPMREDYGMPLGFSLSERQPERVSRAGISFTNWQISDAKKKQISRKFQITSSLNALDRIPG